MVLSASFWCLAGMFNSNKHDFGPIFAALGALRCDPGLRGTCWAFCSTRSSVRYDYRPKIIATDMNRWRT